MSHGETMTMVLLVRHGSTDALGRRLVGRLPGVPLNAAGRAEAHRVGDCLAKLPLQAIWSSPLDRAVDTAEAIAGKQRVDVVLRPGLTDLDFGEWSGMTFEQLRELERFRAFNTFRAGTRPPGGELMVEAQARLVAEVEELCRVHPEGPVAVVSHADPLKALVAHYLGAPLEIYARLGIAPASITTLALGREGVSVECVNDTAHLRSVAACP